MKIAIINPNFEGFGGTERVCLNLAIGLKKKGHQAEIFSYIFGSEPVELLKNEGIKFNTLPLPQSKLFDCRYHYKIAGWLMRDTFKDFDVIYVQNFPAQIWLYYAKQHAKYPFPKIIWICHEPPHQLYSELLEPHRKRQVPNRTQRSWIKEDIKAGSSYETAYCNSEFIANVFHKLYKRVPTVFHFGVNLDRWKNIPILALPKKPTIVIISRLVSPKNIETALRAIALATKKAPELLQTLKVKIGGKGPELENLQIAAKELNLSQIVDFCGFIPDNEIPAFFMQGSFTLFIPLDEPMGLIPIESGLFGRATLGADQGGVPEIIKNNETGILVNPQNIEAIANQIVRLCNDQELAVRLGENARKEVLNNFNFDDYIDKFEAKTLEYSLPRNDCK